MIVELVHEGPLPNQQELVKVLARRGFPVTQATLSRDIHELGLVKTNEGYAVPEAEEHGADSWLPSVEKLIREFDAPKRPLPSDDGEAP